MPNRVEYTQALVQQEGITDVQRELLRGFVHALFTHRDNIPTFEKFKMTRSDNPVKIARPNVEFDVTPRNFVVGMNGILRGFIAELGDENLTDHLTVIIGDVDRIVAQERYDRKIQSLLET